MTTMNNNDLLSRLTALDAARAPSRPPTRLTVRRPCCGRSSATPAGPPARPAPSSAAHSCAG
ncbi:hypothetical protein SAZ11_39175 [Streptomyces sp. FXJ1.4098]|nr:hypothetical protein [Streptomyces sp. FXJ1.4098]